jgi:outer membrane protein TolC
MKKMLLKGLTTLMIMGISASSFAIELSLEDIRTKVLDDNLDIQIQYENYYQAQKSIGIALGDVLPRLSPNVLFFNTTFVILQSVVPTPSSWFTYQASKDLSTAEKYTTTSIKLNILKGLTQNYIDIKKNEKALVSLRKQEVLLLEVYEDAVVREELGIGTETETFMAERSLRQLRQDIFYINTVIVSQKEALLIAMDENPTEELDLSDLPTIEMNIPTTVEEAQVDALDNSTELVSNFYLAQAAKDSVQAARWSFISFDGIGFGYPSTVALSKSNARVIALKRQKIMTEINNQVFTAYKELEIMESRLENQEAIIQIVERNVERQTDLFNGGVITLKQFNEAKINLLVEKRKLVSLTMEKRSKLATARRLLNMDASLVQLDVATYANAELAIQTVKTSRRKAVYSVTLDMDEMHLTNVYAVNYSIEGLSGLESFEVTNADTQFNYSFKLKKAGIYTVKAEVLLSNGKTITKTVAVKF